MSFFENASSWFDPDCLDAAHTGGQIGGVIGGGVGAFAAGAAATEQALTGNELGAWALFSNISTGSAIGTPLGLAAGESAAYGGCELGHWAADILHESDHWFSNPVPAYETPSWSWDMASSNVVLPLFADPITDASHSSWDALSSNGSWSDWGSGTDTTHSAFADAFSSLPTSDTSTFASSWTDHSTSSWDATPAWGDLGNHSNTSAWETASTSWDSGPSWGDSGHSHDGGFGQDSGTGMDSGSVF